MLSPVTFVRFLYVDLAACKVRYGGIFQAAIAAAGEVFGHKKSRPGRPLLSHSLGQQMKSLIPSVILLLPHNRKTKESGFVAS